MKLFYIIPIAIGFSIDVIYFAKWLGAYVKRENLPEANLGVLSVFVLPAWGISGLMYFGKPPEEIFKVWDSFLVVLLLAFCIHIFICVGLPFLCMAVFNIYYGRKLMDTNPLPDVETED